MIHTITLPSVTGVLRFLAPRLATLVAELRSGESRATTWLLAVVIILALGLTLLLWNGWVAAPLGADPVSTPWEAVVFGLIIALFGRFIGAVALLAALVVPFTGSESLIWGSLHLDSPQLALFGAFMLATGWLLAGSRED